MFFTFKIYHSFSGTAYGFHRISRFSSIRHSDAVGIWTKIFVKIVKICTILDHMGRTPRIYEQKIFVTHCTYFIIFGTD